jgi:hypothetical protein
VHRVLLGSPSRLPLRVAVPHRSNAVFSAAAAVAG